MNIDYLNQSQLFYSSFVTFFFFFWCKLAANYSATEIRGN